MMYSIMEEGTIDDVPNDLPVAEVAIITELSS